MLMFMLKMKKKKLMITAMMLSTSKNLRFHKWLVFFASMEVVLPRGFQWYVSTYQLYDIVYVFVCQAFL